MSTEVIEEKPATSAGAGVTELVGRTVEVISMEGHDRYTDVGVLESFETPWINIRKKNNELLCFSVHNIRLIKLIGK